MMFGYWFWEFFRYSGVGMVNIKGINVWEIKSCGCVIYKEYVIDYSYEREDYECYLEDIVFVLIK